ncbi:hypothetical protein CPC08DRAFT_716043 [Agrocybe pediades]|nr:hypothetical protein CPC08DRAFT_716043 [Agrocybe pediades]
MRFTVALIAALFTVSTAAAASANVSTSAHILEVASSNLAPVKCTCPCCIQTGGELNCC